MESKRLKTDALAQARKLIDDHPFELKSFKIGSLATTREFIDVHPFQSAFCGVGVTIFSLHIFAGIPMRVVDRSRIHCLHRRFRDVRDCYFMTLEQFSVNNRN